MSSNSFSLSANATQFSDRDTAEVELSFSLGKPELGYLFALLVPLLAAISSFRDLYLGGINYLAGLSLFAPLVLSGLILVKAGLAPERLRFWSGCWLWPLWYGVIWLSLLWLEGIDQDAIKFAFELSTPFIYGLAGAMFVRTRSQMSWLLYCYCGSILIAFLCVATWKIGLVEFGTGVVTSGMALDGRPHSMSLLPLAALAVALFPRHILLSIVLWISCLLVSGIEGSRGTTLCMLVLPVFHPHVGGLLWRFLSLTLAFTMALGVFYLPAMQERLFPKTGQGTIAELFDTKVSGTGRFDVWPLVLERALEKPWLGHGVSSAARYIPTVWQKMESPHNEFLRIGYEFGVLGLVTFIVVIILQMTLLARKVKWLAYPFDMTASAVFLSFVAFVLLCLTDNPLSSNVRLLNPVFLLLGAALAFKSGIEDPETSRS